MRALLLVVLVAGCTDSALDDDRAFRRLVDRFDTYDQCLADTSLASCYQTFVLCTNRRVMMDLDNRPLDGTYDLDGDMVTAMVEGDIFQFDLARRTSAQLPGRHPWELATPSFTGCDAE
jgi:hypothetical protein